MTSVCCVFTEFGHTVRKQEPFNSADCAIRKMEHCTCVCVCVRICVAVIRACRYYIICFCYSVEENVNKFSFAFAER